MIGMLMLLFLLSLKQKALCTAPSCRKYPRSNIPLILVSKEHFNIWGNSALWILNKYYFHRTKGTLIFWGMLLLYIWNKQYFHRIKVNFDICFRQFLSKDIHILILLAISHSSTVIGLLRSIWCILLVLG